MNKQTNKESMMDYKTTVLNDTIYIEYGDGYNGRLIKIDGTRLQVVWADGKVPEEHEEFDIQINQLYKSFGV